MLPLELLIAGAMMAALTLYALLGGADFGGGVWDLLASGPRAEAQRNLISQAIAPIWEANHVWLILVIVILFVAFPPAFAAVMTALHVPMTLMLIGIVLRGAAFTFRHYDTQRDDTQRRWGRVFAIASTLTPLTLGICIGAIASGKIVAVLPPAEAARADAWRYFFAAWLAPFPLAVGVLALALFAFLAAVFLAAETRDAGLREDFRRRALVAAAAVFAAAWITFHLSGGGAPRIRHGLLHSFWSWPFHILTGGVSTGAILALWRRKYFLARILAALQVTLILWGWGLAQFPFLVEPDWTIDNAAAPEATLRMLLAALLLGAVLLFPSFYLLFRLFKGERAFRITGE